jgi:hypothetical protein
VDISFRVYNVWEHCVKQEDTKLATVLGNKAGPIRRRGSPGRSKYFLGGKKNHCAYCKEEIFKK